MTLTLHLQYAFDPVEGRKPGARTTLMIRNIPNKYTQAMLLDILEDLCRCAAACRVRIPGC